MGARGRLLGVCAALALGCSDQSSEPPRLDRLEIHLTPDISTLMVNDTTRAQVIGFSQYDVPYPVGPNTWRSSDSLIARVSSAGLVEGRGLGSFFVMVTTGGLTDSLPLTIAGTLHASPITASEVWTLADGPHGVRGEVEVGGPGGATVTIESGVSVLFRSGAGLTFGLNDDGVLVASGSASAPITFRSADTSLAPGFWIGLTFRGAMRSQLHHVALRGCGGTRSDGQPSSCIVLGHPFLGADPTLLVDDVTIDVAGGPGLILQGESRFDSASTLLSVHSVHGPVAMLPAQTAQDFPLGGSFGGNDANEIQLFGDTIKQSAAWANAGVPWTVLGPVLIEGALGPVLTIRAGLSLQMAFGGGFVVGKNLPGGLTIGASGGPAVNLLSTSAPGWSGVVFWPSALPSSIRGAVLDNCGSYNDTGYGQGCIFAIGDFTASAGGPAPLLQDLTISHAIDAGLALVGGGQFGAGSGNVVITQTRGSPGTPITTNASSLSSVPPGTYTGNSLDAIWIYTAQVTTSQTWGNHGIPYLFATGLLVEGAANPVLTIDSGATLQFAPGGLLWVGALAPGELHAVGTVTAPIVFTGQYGFAGSWMGVEIGPFAATTTLLDHVIVDDAGADDGQAAAGIRLAQDLGPIVQHTLIRNSAGCGIARMGTSPWVTDFTAAPLGNTFQNNAGADQCGP